MVRKTIFLLSVSLIVAAAVYAETQTVTRKDADGTQVSGDVTRVGNDYQIKKPDGSVITIPKDQVAEVATAKQAYEAKLKGIDATKADDHYSLADWAYEQQLYDIAKKECEATLAIEKDHRRAGLLLPRAIAALAKAPPTTTTTSAPTTKTVKSPKTDLESQLPGMDDINRIRYLELRRDDVVSIEFKKDALEKFIAQMTGTGDFDPNKFRALKPVQQLLQIRKEMERAGGNWADNVTFNNDPKFMTDFKSNLWPIIKQQCASADCHGGEKAVGGFKLFNPPGSTNPKIDYANFLILDMVVTKAGKLLIDRDSPTDSLILQFGLPADIAKERHPKGHKLNVYFTSKNAETYKRTLDWIRDLVAGPHPDYQLQWKPGFGMKFDTGTNTPTSAPTTARSK